ncbi:uncharacterized protein FIBRA_07599 [Fibroporia radiculosa]|uniref:Uncharacterized protein n=1 Tax=Fibroporia radiculosa TaxID=599839 RepID=J4GF30_9APHY|nr:uncharacterized protein FIBRA_07599 [Fibroporia radiculosa]CCM05383.1 predicted protein [Fibroporia radiculosa]
MLAVDLSRGVTAGVEGVAVQANGPLGREDHGQRRPQRPRMSSNTAMSSSVLGTSPASCPFSSIRSPSFDETHALFELPQASTINHICVFLLGTGAPIPLLPIRPSPDVQTVAFPDGYGATVHLHWPGKGFQLLGMLSGEKPSAIFRLRGTFSAQSSHTALFSDGTLGNSATGLTDVTAILGIAIEPLQTIEAEMANLPSAVGRPASRSPQTDAMLLAERIVRHLFNYVSGFAGGAPMTPESLVPLAVVAKWYESFLTKIRNMGVGFLENQE